MIQTVLLAANQFKIWLCSKKRGDSQIVVALVLIAVAVGLCIIFRNQINTIMQNLFQRITNAITSLADGAVGGSSGGSTGG